MISYGVGSCAEPPASKNKDYFQGSACILAWDTENLCIRESLRNGLKSITEVKLILSNHFY